ncbi:MAG TPA: hypothetical protein VHU80_14340, partial [Polyangiaceae bacterium]|nr:hypothetical protein [Polyangiaceae bacterium]
MTEGIVEPLEVVDVDRQDSDGLPGPFGPHHLSRQCFFEISSVEKAGKRVTNRLIAKLVPKSQVRNRERELLRNGLEQYFS